MKGAIGSSKRKPLSELYSEDFSDKAQDCMITAVELARLAHSAMNRQPWRFEVEEELILTSAIKRKD